MHRAPAPCVRPLLVFFLAGLVLLVSTQHALRDPRSQVLPVSFLPGSDICTFHAGSSHTQPTPSSPAHTHQPHCPLCIIAGFSGGAVPLVSLPLPNPRPLATRAFSQPPKFFLGAVFPLLNRGPPPTREV